MNNNAPELEEFYNKEFFFSYSSINKLMFSPNAFYKHYVLNQREDSVDAHLIAGRALHCFLLEEDKFDEQFIILPGKFPSDSIRTVVDNIFNKHFLQQENNSLTLDDFNSEILNELLQINLYQKLKTDTQRLGKVKTDDALEYFEFLKKKKDKSVIDLDTYNRAKESAEVIKSNETISSLMNLKGDAADGIKTFNELKLQTKLSDQPFGLKGILDNVLVDEESKTVFINDLKTTSKPIQKFPESIDYYNYWIQAAVYFILTVNSLLKDEVDLDDWNIHFTFVVIDNYNNVYPFQVSDDTFSKWLLAFEKEVLKIVNYHYTKKDFTLPYELALGNVKL